MKIIQKMIMAGALVLALTINAPAQTNLQFTSVNVTDEGAIQLHWDSQPNHLYEIDEADSLIDTNTGGITWNKLYDNYPSQGTNTFIGDYGNYNLAPPIPHPKYMPMRFYRVVDEGADGLVADEPTVSILSPTNSALASGELTITVIAASDQPVLSRTELYVDGQEMLTADSTTNYTDVSGVTNYEADTYNINTCEWGNGTHTLFAIAQNASGYGDALNAPPVYTGHAVSSFIPVTFNNLVTRISFSQPFFDPSSGQTQQVSAVFPLNSDWTLNIVDAYSNVVQTASGSGMSLLYNWDGTANGTNLPNGIYYYYITAQTNGEPNENLGGSGSGGSGGSPPTPDLAAGSSSLWAVADDSESVVPLAIYPPGFDTNSLTIFAASPADIRALRAASSSVQSSSMDAGGASPDDIGGPGFVTPLPDPQPAPQSSQRPPSNPIKGVAGFFGVAYQDYSFAGLSLPTPLNGFPVLPGQQAQHVQLDGTNGTSAYNPYLESVNIDNFIRQMRRGAWQTGFVKANDQLKASDLQGSGTPFNQVKLGLLTLHGAYGTSVDYNANQAKQIYFPIDGRPNTSSSWVSMSQMSFGGAGTNGLNWMAILACDDLRQANWDSMQNAGITPFNQNLHLLLGSATICDNGGVDLWAKFMLGLDGQRVETIMQAWYNSGASCFNSGITFAVVGYDDCKQDVLNGTNSITPSGSIFYDSKLVRP